MDKPINFDLLLMNLLTILTLINFVLILIFIFFIRTTRMSYTEIMVARKLGAYMLSFLALIIICLMLLRETYVVQMIAYAFNIILTLTLIIIFISNIGRG